MSRVSIDQLIVNSPYEEPCRYWKYDRSTRLFDLETGRRPAGYVVASPDSRSCDDPGVFVEIPLVNRLRPLVRAWRESGYPGVTSVTRRLLEYWTDKEEFETRRFFFCQIEAAETLVWLTEGPEADRVGLEIPSDGGPFPRLCAKMATGSGKTIVMAMVAAWHILNKVAYPRNTRYSRNVLVVAPGLTVRNRLSVLDPEDPENYYESFRIVPSGMMDKLRQGRVLVRNWHALNWETEEKIRNRRGVDKRGARSDEAWVREVLGDMARARNLLVINDEAHHAWRVPSDSKLKGVDKADIKEATRWVGALDRIEKARGIISCCDFSATPFAPSGKHNTEESLFDWIVSDFGLNDAIESGLVKTPRVVIRDDVLPDLKTWRSRLYHIYNDDEVKDDLKRKAEPEDPLPDLVRNGYFLLGFDWRETLRKWQGSRNATPPVMITVANTTETAARIQHAFESGSIAIEELCDPDGILHIDSKVLKAAEEVEEPVVRLADGSGEEGSKRNPTRKEMAERLRQQVDTVGKLGKPGERIRNVISVGMLSEGWDAKTVTHIMGLRAFSSQLLCEQVVGRGLRRTTYEINNETGLFESEYVNIFGVPFTFLPHEGGEDDLPPPPTRPRIPIEPVPEKACHEISWPNIIRIDHGYRPRLSLDWKKLEPLELHAGRTPKIAELAPVVDGREDASRIKTIDLEQLALGNRTQRIAFVVACDVYNRMKPGWTGAKAVLMAQLVGLIDEFVRSDHLRIVPQGTEDDELLRRLVITLNLTQVVWHMKDAIHFRNAESVEPVFDQDRPILSTGDMQRWHTGRPHMPADRCHINFCVYDSGWERTEASVLSRSPQVVAWVKNDHLGFEVLYVEKGVVRKYRPDFLIRFRSGRMLVLEVKGRERKSDRTKRKYMEQWVKAVNEHGGFGHWACDVSRDPGDIGDILARHAGS